MEQVKGLRVRTETIRFLEENIRIFLGFDLGNVFLDSRNTDKTSQNKQVELYQTKKSFCITKEIIEMKSQFQNGKKVFAQQISDQCLMFQIYKGCIHQFSST